MAKRVFDIVFSGLGLVLLSLLLAAVSLAVLVESGRPVFFVQYRVGHKGKLFPLYKFRTMRPGCPGPPLTSVDDSRVTRVGKWLRQYKLDELPQLINVLKGEMSLVGPRPEVPEFVEIFRQDYNKILTVRPGLTDIASIKFRDESARLKADNARKVYLEEILPLKIRYNLQYVDSHRFFGDLALIFYTMAAVFRKETASIQTGAGPGKEAGTKS